MALISVKNGPLYRAWIKHLCKIEGLENSTAKIRTEAFLKSNAGEAIK